MSQGIQKLKRCRPVFGVCGPPAPGPQAAWAVASPLPSPLWCRLSCLADPVELSSGVFSAGSSSCFNACPNTGVIATILPHGTPPSTSHSPPRSPPHSLSSDCSTSDRVTSLLQSIVAGHPAASPPIWPLCFMGAALPCVSASPLPETLPPLNFPSLLFSVPHGASSPEAGRSIIHCLLSTYCAPSAR